MSSPIDKFINQKKYKRFILLVSFNILFFIFLVIFVEILLSVFFNSFLESSGPIIEKNKKYGILTKKNAEVEVVGPEFNVTYHTNEYGFRGQKSPKIKKDKGIRRIMFFGDSFTFGEGNPEEKTIPSIFDSLMNESYKSFEIINCGIPSHSTTNTALYMQEIITKFKPDGVVYSILPNDFFINVTIDDFKSNIESFIQKNTKTNENKNRSIRPQLVDFSIRVALNSDNMYINIYKNTERIKYFSNAIELPVKEKITITMGLLDSINELCKKSEAELLLLYIPQQFEILYESSGTYFEDINTDLLSSALSNYAANKNINFLNSKLSLINQYRRSGEHLYFRLDGHLNSEGNKIIAGYLYENWFDFKN